MVSNVTKMVSNVLFCPKQFEDLNKSLKNLPQRKLPANYDMRQAKCPTLTDLKQIMQCHGNILLKVEMLISSQYDKQNMCEPQLKSN